MAPDFAKLAGMDLNGRKCMRFWEYVNAFEAVKRLKREKYMETHILPQHLSCPVPHGKAALLFDVSQMSAVLDGLRGFGLHRLPGTLRAHHLNRQYPLSAVHTERLKELCAEDFAWVNQDVKNLTWRAENIL